MSEQARQLASEDPLPRPLAEAANKRYPLSHPSLGERSEAVDSGELDWLWHILRKRLWFILSFAAVVTFAAAGVTVLRAPQFTAYAEILVEADDTALSNLRDRQDYTGNRIEPADLESYRRLLNSQSLAVAVVERLGLQPEGNATWLGTVKTAKGLFSGSYFPLPAPLAADNLGTIPARDDMLQEFARRLDVTRDAISRVLTISYTAHDPVQAAHVANELAAVFIEDLARAQSTAAQQTAAYLGERINVLAEELGRAARKVKEFESQSELYPMLGASSLEVMYSRLRLELASAEAELTSARARLQQLSSEPDASRDLLLSPVFGELRRQETEVARNVAKLSEEYGTQHPDFIGAQGELKAATANVQREIKRIETQARNEVSFAEDRVRRIRQQLADEEGKIAKASGMQAQLRELESHAEVAQHIYEVVLERYQRASEQQHVVRPSARVITPARVPVEKSSLSGSLITMAAAMAALAFGTGLAFLLELTRRGYEHPEEIEGDLRLPVLGALPYVRRICGRDASHHDLPNAIYAEAVRRIAIRLIHGDPPCRAARRVVLVTSPLPDEGKSTFCLSLAREWAASRRVILIDCDLRKPQPEQLVVPREPAPGLMDLLTREVADFKAIIAQDQVSSLELLPARGSSKDAFRLLSSQMMEKLMEELRRTYDLIVVDTPPILAVSDAIALAAMADDVVVVTKWNATPRRALRTCLKELAATEIHVSGIILNQVRLKKYARSAVDSYLSHYSHMARYYGT